MKPIITKQENSKFERINFIALKLRETAHDKRANSHAWSDLKDHPARPL
ncbi:hypothetical protein VB002_13075 [Campylobacter concisus]